MEHNLVFALLGEKSVSFYSITPYLLLTEQIISRIETLLTLPVIYHLLHTCQALCCRVFFLYVSVDKHRLMLR